MIVIKPLILLDDELIMLLNMVNMSKYLLKYKNLCDNN